MIEILTPNGFKRPNSIIKLENIPSVRLYLSNDTHLDCAEDHIIYSIDGQEIFAKDSLNKEIKYFLDRDIKVINIEPLGLMSCYDLSVPGEQYFTNNVLSHNSTISAIFILHYVLFNFNKTVAILANKSSVAKEILDRIKVAYQNIPKFLQQGVLEWNKYSIQLENGSKIFAASSSSSSIRGMSISCIDYETSKIVLRNKNTGNVYSNYIKDFIEIFNYILNEEQLNNNHTIILENFSYEIMTPIGFADFTGYSFSKKPCIKITYLIPVTGSINELICTEDHLIKHHIKQRFIQAKDIIEEDLLSTIINMAPAKVLKIEKLDELKIVVDILNIAEDHHSYMSNGLINHNCLFLDECATGDTSITILDNDTKEIQTLNIENLYNNI